MLSQRRLSHYPRPRVHHQSGRLLRQSVLIGSPKKTTDKLQRVRNVAARIVSNTCKYDQGLSHFRRCELHWLDVFDQVRFRVCAQVYKCLHNMTPGYLSTLCQSVSSVPGRRHLRSARRSELDFPHVNLATYGRRVFAYAGPTTWNSLPDSLKKITLTLQTFKRHLKTFYFLHTSTPTVFEVAYKNCAI